MKIKAFIIVSTFFKLVLFGQQVNIPTINDTIFVIEPFTDFYYILDNKQNYSDSIMNIKNSECLINGLDTFFINKSNLVLIERSLFNDSCIKAEISKVYKYFDRNKVVTMPW